MSLRTAQRVHFFCPISHNKKFAMCHCFEYLLHNDVSQACMQSMLLFLVHISAKKVGRLESTGF